jgi:hypothetical protein
MSRKKSRETRENPQSNSKHSHSTSSANRNWTIWTMFLRINEFSLLSSVTFGLDLWPLTFGLLTFGLLTFGL